MTTDATDFRLLPGAKAAGAEPVEQRRAEFLREVVEAATSRPRSERWTTAVRCVAKRGRGQCGGPVAVDQAAGERIEWSCAACGDGGAVAGYRGTEHDLGRFWRSGKKKLWGLDQPQRALLLEATAWIPQLRAVVARAEPARGVDGLLLVQATVRELDQMYTLVEDLSEGARGRRRAMLEELRATLCNSMDGF